MEKFKKIGVTTLKVLGGLFILFFIIGIFSTEPREEKPLRKIVNEPATVTKVDYQAPIEEKEARDIMRKEIEKEVAKGPSYDMEDFYYDYLIACQAGDSSMLDFCGCTLLYYAFHLTDQEFINMSLRFALGDITQADQEILMDATLACISEM